MKVNEMRDMAYNELADEVLALKSELFKLRFQAATNQLDNPGRMKVVKKDIARVKTVMRQMELAGNVQ